MGNVAALRTFQSNSKRGTELNWALALQPLHSALHTSGLQLAPFEQLAKVFYIVLVVLKLLTSVAIAGRQTLCFSYA